MTRLVFYLVVGIRFAQAVGSVAVQLDRSFDYVGSVQGIQWRADLSLCGAVRVLVYLFLNRVNGAE